MFSFLKLMLAGTLALFAAYVFYVEPNASRDPVAAVSLAVDRLATTCERNQAECRFAREVGGNIVYAAGVGWAVVTGQGRLVYVPNPKNARAGDQRWSECQTEYASRADDRALLPWTYSGEKARPC